MPAGPYTGAAGKQFKRTKPILQTTGKNKKLNAVINACQLKNLSIRYCAYGAPVRVEFPAVDYFLQMMRFPGEGLITSGTTSVRHRPGSSTAAAHLFRRTGATRPITMPTARASSCKSTAARLPPSSRH